MGVIGAVAGVAAAGLGALAIGSMFSSSSSSSSYTPKASVTAAHSKSNADMLAELKANVRGDTEKKEKQILENINQSMNAFLDQIEKINNRSFGGKTLSINITEIKNKNDALKKEVIGFIGNYMDDRLVLSDQELSKILKESDDKKRKKKFDAFYKKLQDQALQKLKIKIEFTVHKQEEIIRKEIQNRLTEVDKNMQEASKAAVEIFRMKEEQEDAKIEEKQIQYCYQYELAEILLEQIGN